MAIDSPAKRAAAINVGSPWRSILPFPDGTISTGDRKHTLGYYRVAEVSSLVNTANKRGSAINVGSPWRGILPFPDGNQTNLDRLQGLQLYRLGEAGITIGVPAGGLVLTGYAPSIALGPLSITVPVGNLTLTGYAPTIATSFSVEVPKGELVLTGYAPNVTHDGTVTTTTYTIDAESSESITLDI